MIYKNMANCDLRQFSTAEEFSRIEKFQDIPNLILPKGLSDEARLALASIPRENVVNEYYLEPDAIFNKINGISVIDKNTVASNGRKTYYKINGTAVACDLKPGTELNILKVNGILIIQKNSQVTCNISKVNGTVHTIEFKDYKLYPASISADGNFIRELPKDILIVVGDSITFDDDVTVQEMRAKNVRFAAGDTITAPKDIMGYLKANSTVGDEFVEKRNKFKLFGRR